jgi:asparagine synthetase B (glutamine-hydrolysing)
MAGLFLVRTRDPHFAEAALAGARAQFGLHGFDGPRETTLAGWRLLHAPHILGGPESRLTLGDDFVAVAGTLTYDGAIGRPALEALLRTISLPALDWDRLGGQFVAIVRKDGRTFVFGDYFGAFQLFHDAEMRLLSTSLLAAADAMPRLSFDPQAVYEFAFNVVPIGDDSIFAELKTLRPDKIVELGPDGAVLHRIAKPLPQGPIAIAAEERIERHRERLAAVVRSHVAGFGDRVCCPLSGGLDSRLLLGALRAEGTRPRVYVYGPSDSEDVRIARAIGEAEGFGVEWVNKQAFPKPQADEFAAQVERNFQQYDALPVDGELFESGANAAARDARHAGGALAASGGCGEIYRNFFYLSDRPATARAVARSFFARYDRRDVTDAFDESRFLRGIEDKILGALGIAGERSALPRALVEQIYPRIRCRAFFGREISLEARYGAYLMPFLDHKVVAEAMTLPLRLKNAGRFEAALLNAIAPDLARHPSAYGHDFTGAPGYRHRLSEWTTRARPAWLRQKSYAIQRRLRRGPSSQNGLLGPDYLGRVIDLEFPTMRRYFRMENVGEPGLLRRIACLEYLAARLGSRLSA